MVFVFHRKAMIRAPSIEHSSTFRPCYSQESNAFVDSLQAALCAGGLVTASICEDASTQPKKLASITADVPLDLHDVHHPLRA